MSQTIPTKKLNPEERQRALGFLKILVDIKMQQKGSKIGSSVHKGDGNRFRTTEKKKLTLLTGK